MQREITLAIRGEEDERSGKRAENCEKKEEEKRTCQKRVLPPLHYYFSAGAFDGKTCVCPGAGDGKNGEKGDGFGRDGRRI